MAGACLLLSAVHAAQTSSTERVLRDALSSTDAAKREAALDSLIETHDTNAARLSLLVRLLDDEDQSVAGKAATLLSLYGERAFADLRKTFRDGSMQQQWGAAVALYQMQVDLTPMLPELAAQLGHSDDLAVRASLGALSHVGPAAAPALPALKPLLRHAESEIRWATLETLAAIGPAAKALLPDVELAMKDEEVEVRLAAVAAFRSIQPPVPTTDDRLAGYVAWLREHVPALMQEHRLPGVSIAIVQQYKVYWAQGFGVADVRTRTPVTVDTIFEACSMSKPIMALSALQLIQQHRLELDTPLVSYLGHDYLTDQPEQGLITARMALTHRTGLPNWRFGYDEMGGPLPVLVAPGSDFRYSGEGMLFLQRAMETIVGGPLDAYAGTELFAPLGLTHTSYVWTEAVERSLASGHKEDGAFKERTHYRKANGAYSLYTTPTEYAQLMLTLMRPDVLGERAFTKASVDLMLRHEERMPDEDAIARPGLARSVATYRALGWSVDVTADGDIVEHSGSNSSGFKTFGQFNREKGSALVIFSNGDGGYPVREAIVSQIGDL
jgi:CubicO group peptidase (beta-lactamase class C family)